ncbi:MAG: DUF3299 domain-containing protein [Pseudomonadota bacterium]
MAVQPITRRGLVFGTGAMMATAAAPAARSGQTIDLTWGDLIPGGPDHLTDTIRDLIGYHTASFLQLLPTEVDRTVVEDYNGQQVRLPGYMVPLDFLSTGVTEFLLVPYVGACIHVPPPPPNQIAMVRAETPYETSRYFEAVTVAGRMQTEHLSMDLAEVGYTIGEADVEPYGWR